jgi:hypothetical protein
VASSAVRSILLICFTQQRKPWIRSAEPFSLRLHGQSVVECFSSLTEIKQSITFGILCIHALVFSSYCSLPSSSIVRDYQVHRYCHRSLTTSNLCYAHSAPQTSAGRIGGAVLDGRERPRLGTPKPSSRRLLLASTLPPTTVAITPSRAFSIAVRMQLMQPEALDQNPHGVDCAVVVIF